MFASKHKSRMRIYILDVEAVEYTCTHPKAGDRGRSVKNGRPSAVGTVGTC